ncbi:hypothetical protein RND71_043965 [Anisodus tanguticus]|uniref:Short-chain dehydrogenase n=1 Tax=Anisodus tanguticus TaxID=243964 RepID=A0AAE1QNU2_9SOLA|nr:hypothetical protein RND71_043965 [Anisodus tanguticus]
MIKNKKDSFKALLESWNDLENQNFFHNYKMTNIHSVLITGANRGIGLEFVKQFIKLGSNNVNYIIASCRNPEKASELNDLAKVNENLNILKLDVKDYSKYNEFYNNLFSIVGDKGLDLLINNAGILIRSELDDITPEKMIENFEINTVTPLMLTKSLLPLLKLSAQSKKRTIVANISSKIGSIDDNTSGGRYAYRASKTALNQVTKSLSVDLKSFGIECTAIHPG